MDVERVNYNHDLPIIHLDDLSRNQTETGVSEIFRLLAWFIGHGSVSLVAKTTATRLLRTLVLHRHLFLYPNYNTKPR